NVFIDYMLKDANDAQLKVYLYLIRHITNHKPFDISNIADEFNHTEKDVIRSLKYWEQKQVLSLEFDAQGTVTGIELHKVDEDLVNPKNNLHMFSVLPGIDANTSSSEDSLPETKFSASDFVELSKDATWASIKNIAETYLERTLSANDLQALAHLYKDFGFTTSDIDKVFEDCLTEGKKSMRSIKKAAEAKYLERNISPSVTAIMNALGKKGVPTSDELSFINTWLSDMDLELILEGCKKASMATTGNRIKYASGIFSNWKKSGITSIEEMAREEEKFRERKETAKKQAIACKANNRSITSSSDTNKPQKRVFYDFDEIDRQIRMK
ncbi:MAG: DnaD domain protein, partial [Lachnospiraceae bacterium]|nr:DnaD domain protein [Lachnospiraceae bacterium]